MSRYARVKAWAKRNQDILVLGGISVVVIGLAVVGIKTTLDAQERMLSELNDQIDQLNALARGELR